MESLGDTILSKNEQIEQNDFNCIICNYKCCKKFNYTRHLLSRKHIELTKGDKLTSINEPNEKQNKKYCCEKCNKEFMSRNGLWKHIKTCNFEDEKYVDIQEKETITSSNEIHELKEIMKYLMKENSEMKNMMLEQQNIMIVQNTSTQNMIMKVIENGTHITNNNTTNSHNKAFNLNFFLNETCKDAMNIMDFVDSIKLQLSDLEGVGELGYIEGISKIIVKNLKELDITQRPVHCTDQKRETMYIKDDDKWEKDEERLKLHKVVRRVTCKNQNLIPKFKELHPDYNKYHSKVSDQYNKIIVESMGGSGDNDFEKEEKIIKNISKNVVIEK
jgi:hypothetical protein